MSARYFLVLFIVVVVTIQTPCLAIESSKSVAKGSLPIWLQQELDIYQASGTSKSYLRDSKTLHPIERIAAKAMLNGDLKLPPLKVTKDVYLTFVSNNLTVRILNAQKRIIEVNGTVITASDQENMFSLSEKILAAGKPQAVQRWPFSFWLPEAQAADKDPAKIDTVCLSRLESAALFSVSVSNLARTDLGYTPPFWIANLAIEGWEYASTFGPETPSWALRTAKPYAPQRLQPLMSKFSHSACEREVSELGQLMTKSHISIKDLDCGDQWDGSDQSVSFWTSDFENDGTPKIRSFSLDYSRGLAYESNEIPGDAEKSSRLVNSLYVFNKESLRKRADYNSTDGKNSCEIHDSTDAQFADVKGEIEPFRKVFAYLHQHHSCLKCASEIKVKLASPTRPEWITQLQAKEKAQATTKPSSSDASQ